MIPVRRSSNGMISDESFPKGERLVKTKDFRAVYKTGAFLKRGPVVFYYLANGLGRNRIGFSMRARNIKLAVTRNRIRRLLREAYRRNKKNFKTGHDMVVVVKKSFPKTTPYKTVEEMFLKLAKEAGISR